MTLTRRAVRLSPLAAFSLAAAKLDMRIEQFEQQRWLDMGAVFLTFSVVTHPDGQLVVDR